ncbi:MAG: hypothetical protein EXR97_05395 [Nitrospiraceae bacterium]|nr:hypothetical protein [Nitrospiraceae bacterium]MSR25079.1 hypothetical protein [Nitrospiraceae bacterium]
MTSCGNTSCVTRHAVREFMRIALVCACILIADPEAVLAGDASWDRLADGLEVTVWTPGEACAQVPPLYMLKIDPERFRFAVYHYRAEGLELPLTLGDWHQRTKALALFNAGLFMDDFSYLGLLYKDGKSLGGKRHGLWQGLFIAEPLAPSLKKARVLDLKHDAFDDDKPAYQEAAQSLMLLDRRGMPRVRQSGKAAQQTVVAETREGRLLVIMSKGEVPLWELAVCLRDGLREISHAMAMDGGTSSDVLIGSELSGARTGAMWQPLVDGKGLSHVPLPTVIGVFPRRPN